MVAVGVVLFAVPATVGRAWPWELTPLSGRVVAGWLVPIRLGALAVPVELALHRARILALEPPGHDRRAPAPRLGERLGVVGGVLGEQVADGVRVVGVPGPHVALHPAVEVLRICHLGHSSPDPTQQLSWCPTRPTLSCG